MKTELTPQEVAENLIIAKGFVLSRPELYKSLQIAADDELKIANGEYAPVVRCGECKFFHLHPNDDFVDNAGICTKNTHCCDFSKCEAARFMTDFCSYGKRKDGVE